MEYPTPTEWFLAVVDGFTSNGSSMSPDKILNIPIANGNTDYPPLPADLHDYRYWLGGTDEERIAADDEFLLGLYACVDHLPFLKRRVARRRCRLYRRALGQFGQRFWDYRENMT
jgi:hypothetical protein